MTRRADDATGDDETDSILSDPDLMRAIQEGLADAEAGQTFSHEDVRAALDPDASRSGP